MDSRYHSFQSGWLWLAGIRALIQSCWNVTKCRSRDKERGDSIVVTQEKLHLSIAWAFPGGFISILNEMQVLTVVETDFESI